MTEPKKAETPDPHAVVMQWTWKTDAMSRMALAVCELAMARGVTGEFSALDLPMHGEAEHGGSGIAGSVFGQLAELTIIAPVGVFQGFDFYQKRVRNNHGNPIGVWRLNSRALAETMASRLGWIRPAPAQLDLMAVPS